MKFRTLAAVFGLLAAVVGCGPSPSGEPSGNAGSSGSNPASWARPPVILISIDTLRADHLPAYGYGGVETPYLDALRRDSILFENAYSPVPLTLPAHASILTGRRPPGHGIRDNVGYRLGQDVPTLQGLLRDQGYATGAAVSAYVLRRETGLGEGFDRYFDTIEAEDRAPMALVQRSGAQTLEPAQGWIRQRLEAGEPFFFFLHLFEPHSPYEPPEPFAGRYRHAYDGEVAAVDDVIGRFLAFLREEGLYEPSLIFALADHGEGLGDHGEDEHGLLLYRETLHVPLFLKLPDQVRGGASVTSPVGLIDVLPTVADVLDLRLPEAVASSLAGNSLLDQDLGPRNLYSETFYPRIHFGWHELRSMMGERYHLLEGARAELFDFVRDPGELEDVLADQRRTFRAMEADLARIETRFEDPGIASDEERAKLAALGYLSAPATTTGTLDDPRDSLPILHQMQWAFQLSAEGRLEEAAAALGALLKTHPGLQDVRLRRADVLRVLKRYGDAEKELREAVRRSPSMLPAVSLQLAEVLLEAGDAEGAAEQAAAGLTANAGRARLLMAQAALASGDLTGAQEQARLALGESIPPEVPARLLLARTHLRQAQHSAALRELDLALGAAKRVRQGPVRGLQFLRGEALGRLDRLTAAAAAFEAEIAAFPGDAKVYVQLAFVLAAAQRFDEIEPLFDRLVVARPADESLQAAADTLEKLGNKEAADRWRRRAQNLISDQRAR